MAVFENCCVLLEVRTLSFKEKKKLKSAITENGGTILFVVNKWCSLIVTSDVSSLSSNRLRSIQKYQTPVVGLDYVYNCLDRGALLPFDNYLLDTSPPVFSATSPYHFSEKPDLPRHQASVSTADVVMSTDQAKPVDPAFPAHWLETPQKWQVILDKFRFYTETDSDLPSYPDKFHVAKYSIFVKGNSTTWFVLELQSVRGENGQQYRVVRYWKNDINAKKEAVKDLLVFPSTSEEAVEVYEALRDVLLVNGLQRAYSVPSQAQDLGSFPLQQLLLEEKLNTGCLSDEVGVFVELLWTEALGHLGKILRVPFDKLSLNDVSRAEGLLLHAQKKQREAKHQEATRLLLEVMELLPHWAPRLTDAKFISRTLDLCQLIRDVLNVREMTLRSPASSCLGKYRALRCCMETVPPNSSEFQAVMALLQDSKLQIHQVLRVGRGVELQTFKSELGNIKPLLHSSSPSNFVGILSRGLLLPRVGVEYHGIERTDIGNLGSGIYFTDAVSTSLKYSKPSVTHGSRLLLVCDVALGSCKDVVKRDYTLTEAPNGHHSMHGVRSTPNTSSEFEDDEYVVYSPDQVKLKYVVQFTVEGDQLKEFSPAVTTSEEPQHHDQLLSLEDDGVEIVKDPLGNVTPGLLDSAGQQLPLEAVYVKCKLMDLVSQVVIFQKYTNLSSVPIEAKYVFPLDDSAAVCGFEAYINGKHVVGKVKEKWTARKEYKQAIEKGHGAYLMDQDAPDVFTISVGNLPPRATVLIKVTFVSELIVRGGSILFSLPGSVAPWQKSAALNQTTQVTLEKVYVTDEGASTREFSLDMSVEMPFEIRSLQCITHKIMIKKTACKAVVSVLPGEVMGAEGFQLSISLSEVHLPRMWVEKHPDKDSQACMLVFYPDFDISSHSDGSEVVLLLDTSESMKGESLHMAQRIALQVLKSLDHNLRINVLLFGTDHLGVFQTPKPLVNVRQTAERFIKKFHPIGGSTELWRPLRALSLLPPSRGIRNLLLLSDGHIQNAELTLQLLKDNVQHSRLFTCGLSPTANRHMLRALAQAGGGAYEFFDTKMKHNWAEKVASQVKRMSSPGCNSVSVKWQQFNPTAPTPVQAPKQLHALFNDCHTLVYGFVPHCTQATLLGNLSGQELNTMVSTSELQMTRGTFLHKLTARAIIRDYEDGSLDTSEAEHEGKKAELKSFIIELSKEFSILSQFTSFLAIEERDSEQPEDGFTDIPKLVAEENVDFLPYMSWSLPQEMEMRESPSIVTMSCLLYEEEASCSSFDPPRKVAARKAMKKSSKLIKGHDKIKHLSVGASFGQAASALHHYVKCSSKVPQADVPLMPPPPPLLHHIAAPQISLPASLITPPPPEPPCSAAPTSPSFGVLGSLNLEAVLSNASLKMSRGRARRAASSELEMTHDAPRCSLTVPQAAVPLKPSSLPRRHHLTPLQSTKVLASSMPPPPCPAEPPPPPTGSSPSLDVGVVPTNTCIKLRGRARQAALSELEISHDSEADVPLMPPPPPPVYSHAMASPMPPPPPPRPAAPPPPPASFFQSLDSGLVPTNTSLKRKPKMLERVVFMGQSGTSKECGPSRLGGFSPAQSIVTLDLPMTSDLPMPEIQPIMHQASLEFADAAPAAALFGAASFQSEPEPAECFSNLTRLFRHKKRVKERRYEHMATTDTADILRIKPKLKWERIFHLQHSEGYWELTTELGGLINVNLDLFANVFLKDKGICSLGARAHADILKLVATLLVLQLMRVEKLEEGKLLRTLFCLVSSSQPRPEHWDKVRRAVEWVGWADKQYPCIYSRLEFGLSWESSTRQLLGYEDLPPYSALSGLNLQRPAVPLLVQ